MSVLVIFYWTPCKGIQQPLLRELPTSSDSRREKILRKLRKPQKRKVPQARGRRLSSPDRNRHILSIIIIFSDALQTYLNIFTVYKSLQKLVCKVKKARRTKARALRSGLSTLLGFSLALCCALLKQLRDHMCCLCVVSHCTTVSALPGYLYCNILSQLN